MDRNTCVLNYKEDHRLPSHRTRCSSSSSSSPSSCSVLPRLERQTYSSSSSSGWLEYSSPSSVEGDVGSAILHSGTEANCWATKPAGATPWLRPELCAFVGVFNLWKDCGYVCLRVKVHIQQTVCSKEERWCISFLNDWQSLCVLKRASFWKCVSVRMPYESLVCVSLVPVVARRDQITWLLPVSSVTGQWMAYPTLS